MDSQRYVSIGDGNVYLAVSDPLDAFDVGLSELIKNDEPPSWDQVTGLTFTGAEAYSVFYEGENNYTYSAEDVYFTQQNGETLPLDTSRTEDYLNVIQYLDLSDYVTYNATEEGLQVFGLDDPELTVTVEYTYESESGETLSDSFVLHISRDPDEQDTESASENEDEEESAEEITAYARVGESPIVYQIAGDDYKALMACSYDDLRHREVIWADFADIDQLDISLDGQSYTIAAEGEGDTRTYLYQGTEIDIADLQSALEGLEAETFTSAEPSGQEEISLTVHLSDENFSQVQIQLYRYDGTYCLAAVDGQPVSLVPRTDAVDLMEAVRAIVL